MTPTICVDFDGTLCEHTFPGIGEIKTGAALAMNTLKRLGYRLIIFSCRTSHHHYDVFGGTPGEPTLSRPRVKEMIDFLDTHGIPYDEIDDGSKGKPLADFYIDDKGLRFNDNWMEILSFIAQKGFV